MLPCWPTTTVNGASPITSDGALFELLTLGKARSRAVVADDPGAPWRVPPAYHGFDIDRVSADARCRTGKAAGCVRG